jgi:Tfp pilus assembly protein PilX
MNLGPWLYVLITVLVVLAILYLVGVRFDLNAS